MYMNIPSPVSGSGLPPLAEPRKVSCSVCRRLAVALSFQSLGRRCSSETKVVCVSNSRRLQSVAGLNEREKSVREPSLK
ncbi:hypothetical protein D3C80_1505000 [compost metagenome]